MSNDADLVDEGEFFMELNDGRKFTAVTREKKKVKLTLQSPSIEDVRKAREIIERYRESQGHDESRDLVCTEVVQIACIGCIQGVTEENVMAFISRFHRASRIIIECLRIIDIEGSDLELIGIDINSITDSEMYEDEIPF